MSVVVLVIWVLCAEAGISFFVQKRTAPGDGGGSVQLEFRSPPDLLEHDALGRLAGFALYYYKVYATSEPT